MAPLIMFCGDVHGKSYQMFEVLNDWQTRTDTKIDAIVQVGDFAIFKSSGSYVSQFHQYWNGSYQIPIPTYVCMGNHEDISIIKEWENEPDKIPNLHLIPDGGVIDVAGIKIGCIWGNYSPKAWMRPELVAASRERKVSGSKRAMHIWKNSVDKLLTYDGKLDVLITHDCATCFVPRGFGGPMPEEIKSIMGLDSDENTPPGCPGFTQLLDKFQPSYYFFGHFHVREELKKGNTTMICLHAFDYSAIDSLAMIDFEKDNTNVIINI